MPSWFDFNFFSIWNQCHFIPESPQLYIDQCSSVRGNNASLIIKLMSWWDNFTLRSAASSSELLRHLAGPMLWKTIQALSFTVTPVRVMNRLQWHRLEWPSGYSDIFVLPKRISSYWKSSDKVTISYSDTCNVVHSIVTITNMDCIAALIRNETEDSFYFQRCGEMGDIAVPEFCLI